MGFSRSSFVDATMKELDRLIKIKRMERRCAE